MRRSRLLPDYASEGQCQECCALMLNGGVAKARALGRVGAGNSKWTKSGLPKHLLRSHQSCHLFEQQAYLAVIDSAFDVIRKQGFLERKQT